MRSRQQGRRIGWWDEPYSSDLGLTNVRIMTNNPKKIYGIEGYGLKVVEKVPVRIEPGEHNRRYLETKKAKLGHKL